MDSTRETEKEYPHQPLPAFMHPASHNFPSSSDTMQYALSPGQSPWMSGTDASMSPFMDGGYTPDMGVDVSTMDLSWLQNNTPNVYNPNTPPINHYQHTSNNPQTSHTVRPDTQYPLPVHTPVDTSSLASLLASSTSLHCQQLLEDPVRRKPGRKPKGSISPMPPVHPTINYDDMNEGDRKEDRKFKNREAADQSRKRLKDRTKALEQFSGILSEENEALRRHLAELQQKN